MGKTFKPHILGVDPGQSGGLAVFDPQQSRLITALTMPTTTEKIPIKNYKLKAVNKRGMNRKDDFGPYQRHAKKRPVRYKTRTHIDLTATTAFFEEHSPTIALAIVERVHSMPKQGVASTFKFGENVGIIKGIIAAHAIPTFFVEPSVWKPLMGLLGGRKNKNQSCDKARSLFPDFPNLEILSKDGPAEAALLAYFGRRIYLNTVRTEETPLDINSLPEPTPDLDEQLETEDLLS